MSKNELMLDVSQAHELKMAGRRAGASNTDFHELSRGDNLAMILPFLRGYADITLKEGIIDCNAEPFSSNDYMIQLHRKMGYLDWGRDKVDLLSTKHWIDDERSLMRLIEDHSALNACVLEFLKAHPERIPEAWRPYTIYFLGTSYNGSSSMVFRGLHLEDGYWVECVTWASQIITSSSKSRVAILCK